MIAFEVNDMACGRCVSTITKALKAIDRNAKVHVDLATHLAQIEATSADADELAKAINGAGYMPVQANAVPAGRDGKSYASGQLTLNRRAEAARMVSTNANKWTPCQTPSRPVAGATMQT